MRITANIAHYFVYSSYKKVSSASTLMLDKAVDMVGKWDVAAQIRLGSHNRGYCVNYMYVIDKTWWLLWLWRYLLSLDLHKASLHVRQAAFQE